MAAGVQCRRYEYNSQGSLSVSQNRVTEHRLAFASVRSPQLLGRALGQGSVMFMKYLAIAV